MSEISEVHELAEEAHGQRNKVIALLIAALALMLAFAEAGNGNNENASIDLNIEASNLWSFYQAKTIRMTTMQTAAEQGELELPRITDPAQLEAVKKQIEKWRATAQRYDSEPATGEGRKELAARAIAKQEERKITMQRKELYEVAAKTFQIGIVLASAMIITGLMPLVWAAILLGLTGATLMGFALFAPMAIHLPF
ncbi:MAG: DUF4337 domain-containing protein [Proteobacteria bacterium]|nr:DUF4337 domain-containing protein [Pseudomonadota bacterium]